MPPSSSDEEAVSVAAELKLLLIQAAASRVGKAGGMAEWQSKKTGVESRKERAFAAPADPLALKTVNSSPCRRRWTIWSAAAQRRRVAPAPRPGLRLCCQCRPTTFRQPVAPMHSCNMQRCVQRQTLQPCSGAWLGCWCRRRRCACRPSWKSAASATPPS